MPNPSFPLDSNGLRVGGAVDPYDSGTVAYNLRARGTASGGTTFTRDSRALAVYEEGWVAFAGTVYTFGTAGTAIRGRGTAAGGTVNLPYRLMVGLVNEGTADVFIGTVSPPTSTNAGWVLAKAGSVGADRWERPFSALLNLYMAPAAGTAVVRVFEAS